MIKVDFHLIQLSTDILHMDSNYESFFFLYLPLIKQKS